jgi:hypothetical protein
MGSGRFQELIVWQKAMSLAKEFYLLTDTLEERAIKGINKCKMQIVKLAPAPVLAAVPVPVP